MNHASRMRGFPTPIATAALVLTTFAMACASEAPTSQAQTGSAGNSPSASTSTTGSTGAAGGDTTTAMNSTSSAPASGQGGGGGTTGSDCPAIFIDDGVPQSCSASAGMLDHADQTECPTDSAIYWPARIFALQVNAGDCIAMQADNAGSPLGADLFGAIVTPEGSSILYDEEIPCSVTNPEGYACPSGGATTTMLGIAYVMVGSWEGQGCKATETTPYTLRISLNGMAIDPAQLAVCSGDLQTIIP